GARRCDRGAARRAVHGRGAPPDHRSRRRRASGPVVALAGAFGWRQRGPACRGVAAAVCAPSGGTDMSSLSMSRTQREAFLAGTHVAILSVADGARGPFTVPVWYRYEPGGEICFVTGGTSRKHPPIKKAGR